MTFLYRIYQVLFAYPVFFLVTVWTTLCIVVGCKIGDAHFWGYWPAKVWSKAAIRLFLLPVSVEGRENIKDDESYVFVANHQGFYDIFLVFGYLQRNIKWMMKWQITKWPFIGISCVKSHQIIVDKRSRAAIKKTYDDARRTLKGGTSVVVFPEGARTRTGEIEEFHRGAFALADELQLPVVPLTINGSFNVMPRHRDVKFVIRHPLKLTVHKPIYPTTVGMENQMRTMNESYEAIKSALEL